MRRYQLKYHVVGGFSFYERAEIKDMISYLKVIQNPDDTISLLRVINTPVRGIGKATIDLLESLALETGLSLWGAIGRRWRQLLPQRALGALKNFRDLIEDARAMLAGTTPKDWRKRNRGSSGDRVGPGPAPAEPTKLGRTEQGDDPADDTDFSPENFSFDFGLR